MVPRPSYGLKIVHGSPMPQFTIFRETEQLLSTLVNFNVSVYARVMNAWLATT